jgi:hypothetical protein
MPIVRRLSAGGKVGDISARRSAPAADSLSSNSHDQALERTEAVGRRDSQSPRIWSAVNKQQEVLAVTQLAWHRRGLSLLAMVPQELDLNASDRVE